MAQQVTIRQGTYPHIKVGQGNLVGRKGSQEQEKSHRHLLLPLLREPQEHKVAHSTVTYM